MSQKVSALSSESKYRNEKSIINNLEFNNFKFKFDKLFKRFIELFFELLFRFSAFITIICVAAISIFIFVKGSPAIFEIGFSDFVFGLKWNPSKELFGIFPMIIGSVSVTFGAILIGVPIGILTAIFIFEYAPKRAADIINSAVNLLAGIPSVVYGFFGIVVIVPMISNIFGGVGNSMLAAIIILAIMILPTIISTTRTALNSVPREYMEGSIALGASREQTIFGVLLRAGKSGIFSGIVLGIGRAIGETMAVILVAGNAAIMPDSLDSIIKPIRTLTANISLEMGYASGIHQEALFATGVILFIFIMILNVVLNFISGKTGE